MSKIHNLVYDRQQKDLCEAKMSLKARRLKDRIDYLDFEIESIMNERTDVVKAYRKEISK